MKHQERRNLAYRFIATFILILVIGFVGFGFYELIKLSPEALVLDIITLSAVAFFSLFQIILIMKGWKKDSHLYDVAFNANETVNNVPLIAVIIGSIIGLGLSIVCTILFISKDDIDTKCNLLIILAISIYLFLNCVIYYIYLLIFRKRLFKVEDLLK